MWAIALYNSLFVLIVIMILGRICRAGFGNKVSGVRILYTEGNNIHFNLALEEYMFEVEAMSKPTLFLWRNSPTIVIGKHQNPWKECRVEAMKQDGVLLSRRKTGGGAVYHDLGNTCFSFLTPFDKNDRIDYRDSNNSIIINALRNLGVTAHKNGRNDLTVGDKKFSGSAYRLGLGNKYGEGKKSLHHGTVMFSVDFQALSKYLNPNKKKLESKGVDSVISRVINLQDAYPHVNHQTFCREIEKQFVHYYGNQPVERETVDLSDIETVKNNFERLKSWDWLYGECPYFKYTIEKKFPWGLTEITFEVENGHISKCKVYSDCLYPDFISQIQGDLRGAKYSQEGLSCLQQSLSQKYSADQNLESMAQDICDWITSQI